MALVTPNAKIEIDASSALIAPQIIRDNALVAGEALDAAAPCYIKGSDGKVYMSNGTAANEAARCLGFTPKAYAAGEPVTLFEGGAEFEYGAGMTPGAPLYVGGTKGRLDTAATTGGTTPVAYAKTAKVIRTLPVRL